MDGIASVVGGLDRWSGGKRYRTGSEAAAAAERRGRGRRGRSEGRQRSRIGSTTTSAVASLAVVARSMPTS